MQVGSARITNSRRVLALAAFHSFQELASVLKEWMDPGCRLDRGTNGQAFIPTPPLGP